MLIDTELKNKLKNVEKITSKYLHIPISCRYFAPAFTSEEGLENDKTGS